MSNVRRMYSWEILEILPLLHKFNVESGYGYPIDDRAVMTGLVDLILAKRGVVIVHVHEGKIVGVLGAMITTFFGSTTERTSELFFYIEPEHRGGTFAARMVKQYISWAKERGIDRCQLIALSSTDTEGKVRQFYEALGFSQVETAFEIRNH